jgi:predicted nucleic acid-binding protein
VQRGPLIALAGLGQVPILRQLFDTVLVASEVRAEVEAEESTGAGGLFDSAPWLQAADLSRPANPLLSSLLDAGEAATIALALERTATLVLIEEQKLAASLAISTTLRSSGPAGCSWRRNGPP